jgi:hypothetical protein
VPRARAATTRARTPALLKGLLLVGLLAGRFMNRNGGHGHYHHSPYLSDQRLKTDIEHVATTDDGIRVYKFRYKGDERLFTGVIAQEILATPNLKHAVAQKGGYYTVDYSAMGMVLKNPEIMKEAGEAAIARAM